MSALVLGSALALAPLAARTALAVAVANPDSYTLLEDSIFSIAAPGVLGNDTKDGALWAKCLVSNTLPAHALTFEISANGHFLYAPLPDVNGTDTFSYGMAEYITSTSTCPATSTSGAFVTLNITPVNDAPSAHADLGCTGGITVAEDSQAYIGTQPCADPVSMGPSNESDQHVQAWLVTTNHPEDFTAAPSIDPVENLLSFLLAPNAFGTVTVTVRAQDNGGTANFGIDTSAPFTFAITITGSPDAPVAANDSYSVQTGTTLMRSAPGVLANDSDPDHDPITAQKLTDPSHGAVTLNANGSLSYTPNGGYVGPDSFTYRASDGTLTSTAKTVSINVTATPPSPTPSPTPTASAAPTATATSSTGPSAAPTAEASAGSSPGGSPGADGSAIPGSSPVSGSGEPGPSGAGGTQSGASGQPGAAGSQAPEPAATSDGGSFLPAILGVLTLIALIVAATVLIPRWRRRPPTG